MADSLHKAHPDHGPRRPRTTMGVPRLFVYGAMMLVCLAFVPPAIVARVRANPSPNRGIALIQNMAAQPKLKAQQPNELFNDLRAMRPHIPGTVAREDRSALDVAAQGAAAGEWSRTLPPEIAFDAELLNRGRERFAIYCAPCHGYAGFGDGIVNARAEALISNINGPVKGTVWVQPKSVHDPEVEAQPVGQIYHTITYGIRNMAGYAAQVPERDRWAIAAYVKALQRSQNAGEKDVPADKRTFLKPAA